MESAEAAYPHRDHVLPLLSRTHPVRAAVPYNRMDARQRPGQAFAAREGLPQARRGRGADSAARFTAAALIRAANRQPSRRTTK